MYTRQHWSMSVSLCTHGKHWSMSVNHCTHGKHWSMSVNHCTHGKHCSMSVSHCTHGKDWSLNVNLCTHGNCSGQFISYCYLYWISFVTEHISVSVYMYMYTRLGVYKEPKRAWSTGQPAGRFRRRTSVVRVLRSPVRVWLQWTSAPAGVS